jgi:hypothetical protein
MMEGTDRFWVLKIAISFNVKWKYLDTTYAPKV